MSGSYRMVVERGVEMTARDGTILRADVYRPDSAGQFPVLLVRTPYDRSRDEDQTEARHFTPAGYVVVVQDVRGRWGSNGAFYPRIHEGEDGYDAVEWAARLPWSNGRVGMIGQSYVASCQFAAAAERPPSLLAAAPTAGPMYLTRAAGGLMEFGWTLPYYIYCARTALKKAGRMAEFRPRFAEWLVDPKDPFSSLKPEWFAHLPLTDWAEWLGEAAPYIRDVVTRLPEDPFWRDYDIGRRLGAIHVPMFHAGSWYDAYGSETLAMYEGLKRSAGSVAARAGQRLLMGPWGHLFPFAAPTSGGTGDIDFGEEAKIELHKAQQPFFDLHLKGVADALNGEPPVRIFVMGENRWRDESEWPLSRAVDTLLHLDDGALRWEPPVTDGADHYVYDPQDPVPTHGGNGLGPALGVRDQRPIEARPDVLVYTSEPLESPVELTGPIRLELFVASSASDTDFVARLCDVRPDGYSQNISEGAIRMRYRDGLDQPAPVTPGEVYRVVIHLNAISHLVAAGHRLRLQVTSSNFPRFDRNLNNGGGRDGVVSSPARQTVLRGPARPSALCLPVIPR